MNFLSLIESKRDGGCLASDAIPEIVREYLAGAIPDYQMSALLMAIYFRGLDPQETRALTLAMRDSGDVLKFPADPRPLVDKHSTGGVGDKVSLPLAPLLACLGFRVPMISGRGLGITGGTLDKLESIPGFTTHISAEHIVSQVQSIGCVICGQTDHMVPADKALYALRDVTGTVPSIALITASILSKKLSESLDALLLDVKFGSAAFMRSYEQAQALAQSMVTLGRECGVNTRALLTNMNTPLGRAAGNWLEVKESVACLENHGPADLTQLVVEFAAHLLVQTGRAANLAEARSQASRCLASGQPRRKWDQMLAAQGADLQAFNGKLKLDHTAMAVWELKSPRSGYVARCDARIVGELVRDLGGGRLTKEATLNHDVGVDALAKPGQSISPGSVLARVHAVDTAQAESACARLQTAFAFSDNPPTLLPLIADDSNRPS
jgi:pyrimidine-nucleoside phosphorylase